MAKFFVYFVLTNSLVFDLNIQTPKSGIHCSANTNSTSSHMINVILHLPAATINFMQQAYNVNEADGKVEPVLVLSNPSSTDLTVQVFSTDGSATGKQLTISCTIIE